MATTGARSSVRELVQPRLIDDQHLVLVHVDDVALAQLGEGAARRLQAQAKIVGDVQRPASTFRAA